MFDLIDQQLAEHGCDGTLRFTILAAERVGFDPTMVSRVMTRRSAYCDCEVMFNVADLPP